MQEKIVRDFEINASIDGALWQAAVEVLETLRAAGHSTFFAGGCVRDHLLGVPLHDIDIATAAHPDEVARLFPRTVAVGRAFGVVRVLHGAHAFDVASFRAESDYRDGRRPAQIRFTDAREDVLRRDFTINGLLMDPLTQAVVDYVGGAADLRARRIRAIGPAFERFQEDHLRLLRAVRFATTLDFTIESATETAIRHHAPLIRRVSAERIGDELTRILCEARLAGGAVERLSDLGLLREILPEVEAMRGVLQPPRFHPEGDVFQHTCLMLNALAAPRDPIMAYAVLLHDAGKPATFIQSDAHDPNSRRFPNHAVLGEALSVKVLARLKRPVALGQPVARMVRRHMQFADAPAMREARLRRFIGAPSFEHEMELHRLDCLFSNGDLSIYRFLRNRLDALRTEPVLPEPWLRGRDLLEMGLPPGPDVGRLLQTAYDAQLEGKAPDRDALIAWIRGHAIAEKLIPR